MSNDLIFKNTAPRYWAANIPVIPLVPRDKRPVVENWQAFADCMPGVDQQRFWLERYPNGNIGLPMGRQSGLVAVDIDTMDNEIIQIIEEVCGPSPWKRVGAKGMVMVYKYNGHKTARIKNNKGETIVEILSARTQIVIPPSIHPKTGEPYMANADLLDLIERKQIPVLPTNVEMVIREALTDHGVELAVTGMSRITDWTPAGSRDNKMTSVAGLLATGITRGELSLMEAFGRMDAWWESFQERVVGDEVNPQKGRSKIIEFLTRDVNGPKRRPLPKGWDRDLSDEDKAQMGLVFDQDVEEWDVNQLKTYMLAEFERHPKDSQGRMAVIKYMLLKISRSPSLSLLDIEHLFSWIAATTPNYTVAALRKSLKELTSGELLGLDHTEIARAVLDEMGQYGEVRFHQGNFWQWGGSHWEVRETNQILTFIAEHYGSGFAATKRQSDHRGIMNVMSVLCAKELKSTSSYSEGINFANGYLTSSGELLDHDPRFGTTYTLPYRYVAENSGKAFRFQQFLHQSWGRDEDFEDKVRALQEAICVTIFGLGPMFQRAICLYGVPHSGKSVLLEVIQSLLPEEAKCAVQPTSWGEKYTSERLIGKLINVVTEMSGDTFIDGEVFKKVVTGETMTVEQKYKPVYEARPICTHWVASNHLPRTKDKSSAFNRRWLFFLFNFPCPEDQLDRNLALKIITEEREAIVAWAVEAMGWLNERGVYTMPNSHRFLVKEMASNNNSVRFFMVESGMVSVVRSGSDGKTTVEISEDKLYRAYYSCCFGPASARPVSSRLFRQLMRELATELKFEMVEKENAAGATVVSYKFLTLADNPGMLKSA